MTTGIDVLREAVRIRGKKQNLANMARDHHIATTRLEDFAIGKADLPPEVLKALATELSQGSSEYDPTTNMLRPTHRQEATSIGRGLGPIEEMMTLPKYQGGPPPLFPRDKSKPEPAKIAKRPGWA